ncbi:TPA: hypothetical protein PCG80_004782 [Klebsiella pneumoniae]|nr:hypothetical protein [Klebsiella pneumoniae]HDE2612798.1 hypothetical protein [Klebsiella pneumoniae]
MLNKNPLKAGRNTKGKSDGGSRNDPKVEGLDVVAVPFAAGIRRHGEPLPHHLAHSPQRKESYLPQWAVHNHGVASGNFLTCCVLRFVELTARRSIWHLSGLI